jgi:hypothetical protein
MADCRIDTPAHRLISSEDRATLHGSWGEILIEAAEEVDNRAFGVRSSDELPFSAPDLPIPGPRARVETGGPASVAA